MRSALKNVPLIQLHCSRLKPGLNPKSGLSLCWGYSNQSPRVSSQPLPRVNVSHPSGDLAPRSLFILDPPTPCLQPASLAFINSSPHLKRFLEKLKFSDKIFQPLS